MNLKQVSLALALAGTVTLSHGITITAQNKCDKPAPYKVERKGSTLNTTLSQRASTSHSLDNGDRIKVGDNVVHSVSASSNGKTVIVCNK